MKNIMKIFALTAVLTLLSGIVATAQTGITPGAGSTADAIHYHGAWTAGTTEYVDFDVKDSTADSKGYVDSLYAGGLGRIYSSAGFDTYAGYAEYVPTKTLASLIKGTNLPIDSLRVYVRGGVGETLPSTGQNYMTGFAGAGASIALNNSGTITWETVYGEWQNPGIWVVKSGVTFSNLFVSTSASSQSKASVNLRRAGLKR